MKLQMKTAKGKGKRQKMAVTDVDISHIIITLVIVSCYFSALCCKNPQIPTGPSHVFQLPGPLIEPRPVQIDWVIPVCQRHSEGLPEDTSTQLQPIRIPL